ncbi:MAG TPA: glycosyltransferase family 39 protein [Caulobacterales bacterium]|nr:glycosyltransferase family 39 protein [Caulobacterales bacterium]
MDRTLVYWLLAAVALLGVAHVAFLPPWEGFDETAHYSSVQQIADTGAIPLLGRDRLGADVEAYRGPQHYGAGALTYRDFARGEGAAIDAPASRQYRPGATKNWQAQHPPLFYALMTPVYHATKHLGWKGHLFSLRLAAWVLAFAGVAVGALGALKLTGNTHVAAVTAGLPLFSPQFFPEMARLGNDSLCLLLTSIAWVLSLRLLQTAPARAWAAPALGVVLGLGLLTKAFFLPLTIGVVLLLALRERRAPALREAGIVLGAACLIGGWWYVRNLGLFGTLSGANDFNEGPGFNLLAQLAANFSFVRWIKGAAGLALSYLWGGTWSLIRAPEALLLATAALTGLTLANWARRARDLAAWAPAFFIAPVLAALLVHLAHVLAAPSPDFGTPAWYMFIATAPLGAAMAQGWRPPRLCLGLAVAGFVSAMGLWLLQLALFSGAAIPVGPQRRYGFDGAAMIDYDALRAVALPGAGFVALALALACLAAAAYAFVRAARR